MSLIPEGLPPERAEEFSGVGKKPPHSPEEQKIQDIEIASLGGMPSGRTGPLISAHAVANLTPPGTIAFLVQNKVPFVAAQAVVDAIHEELREVVSEAVKGIVQHIRSLNDNPEGQHHVCHEMRHQIQQDHSLDERSKNGLSTFFKSYQPVIEIVSGDTKTYFNGLNIDIVGLPPGLSVQQHIQNLQAANLIPPQHAQQFQAAAPKAKTRTPQQSQAAQAQGKAVAAKFMQDIHTIAITIAQQKKAEKEEAPTQRSVEEQAPSASSSRQKASPIVEREIYEASHLFSTAVTHKKEGMLAGELEEVRQQKEHLHEEKATSKARQKKQKARKILSEERTETQKKKSGEKI
jgi:hypothetical protein